MIYSNLVNIKFCAIVFLFALAGCSIDRAIDRAHENFKTGLNYFVGRDFAEARNFYRGKIERENLANGNIEYRLTGRLSNKYGPCTKIFEVEPVTHKVLRADFMGTKSDCITPL